MAKPLAEGQYETIDPPNPLKNKVRMLRGRDAQIDPVKKAERAIERLSANFADWMDEEVERLINQWTTNKSVGFTPEAKGALYRAAHDMRGQAPTLGFPSAGRIAGIFCDILDAIGEDDVPDTFLEQYITAIRAIARETRQGEDNETAKKLADQLAEVGRDLIARQRDAQASKPSEKPSDQAA